MHKLILIQIEKTVKTMTEEKNKNNIYYQPRMFVGTDDFKALLLNGDIFVDKSLMIKKLLEDSRSSHTHYSSKTLGEESEYGYGVQIHGNRDRLI